ncbi:hypothetical protein AA23498_3530 [Acetobacter nitrogenifigens DSM 23921 = NBRC 105050]|uniref:Uncharacterized protein n=1 Tax=Acetobacter nitrogenifigens DSM 23921 = NBRC 105050 TaxID=1120919 RepID=A0A511XES2_9PROT|nr:hypothetical protein AA23498_3530 [Acetobacter nitrogenifigens DSM 23921 = NBRC 105050]GEN61462.1 hypothetical protein ANI02nite_33460 [Acetobacter nitrogenifigens DSM 23921 = NBRC 105050]
MIAGTPCWSLRDAIAERYDYWRSHGRLDVQSGNERWPPLVHGPIKVRFARAIAGT